MPELQTLHLYFRTHETIANYSGVDGNGIENLSRLKKLCVDVDCSGSTREEVEAAEDSIRKAADSYRTKLTLEIQRWCEACMIEEEAHDGNAEFPSRSVNRRANPVRVAFRCHFVDPRKHVSMNLFQFFNYIYVLLIGIMACI